MGGGKQRPGSGVDTSPLAISLGCRRSERRKEAVGLSLSPCLAAPRVCSIGEDDTWVPVTLHNLLQLQRTRAQVTHSPRCQGPGLCPCVKVVPNLALRGRSTQPRTSRARSLGRATGCRAPGAPCRVCTRRPCRRCHRTKRKGKEEGESGVVRNRVVGCAVPLWPSPAQVLRHGRKALH